MLCVDPLGGGEAHNQYELFLCSLARHTDHDVDSKPNLIDGFYILTGITPSQGVMTPVVRWSAFYWFQ